MANARLICPITREEMNDPVIDPEGNSYEREAILSWVAEHGTSPLTRSPLTSRDLVPNRALREMIEKHHEDSCAPTVEPPTLPLDGNVKMEMTLTEQSIDQDVVDVLVSLHPPPGSVPTPTDVVCVVDTSGSMGTAATIKNEAGETESDGLSLLDVVKHAVKAIIASLKPSDRLGLVAYSSNARLVMGLLPMNEDGKRKANLALETLSPGGMTNLWDGLHTGLEQIRRGIDENTAASAKRQGSVLVLTDGLPNINPPRGILPMLRKYRDQHALPLCSVSTFGFGYSLDSALLEELAVEGTGAFSFIPDASFVGTVFVHAVANLRAQCNGAATLTLEPDAGAEILKFAGDVEGGSVGVKNNPQEEDEDGVHNNAIPRTLTSWGASLPLPSPQYGQTKNVVVRMRLAPGSAAARGDAPYLHVAFANGAAEASCHHHMRDTGDEEEAELDARRREDTEIAYHRARAELVGSLGRALALGTAGKIDDARSLVCSLVETISAARASSKEARADTRLRDLEKDAAGQVTEAVSRADWFERWGAHYLRSLRRAHALQQCNNFKDPGVGHYGGALFEKLRDDADEAFMRLPAPKPSAPAARTGGGGGTPISMSRYNNSAGPCFHGAARVLLADGTVRRCDGLRRGDLVRTRRATELRAAGRPEEGSDDSGEAEVVCVVRTACPGGTADLVRIGELLVTPYHPVRMSSREAWGFPCELEGARPEPSCACEAVYSFVLAPREAAMLIDGVQCIALGHGLDDGDVLDKDVECCAPAPAGPNPAAAAVLSHAYYGTEAVVSDLRHLRGWDEGVVHLQGDTCIERDASTGLVSHLVQSAE